MRIKWDHFITNDEVLQRADVDDMEVTLTRDRLRWIGHIARMDNARPVKALLYGELETGSRKIGRPLLRYKDVMKATLKRGEVLKRWKVVVEDRRQWRELVSEVCSKVDDWRISQNSQRRAKRHSKKQGK